MREESEWKESGVKWKGEKIKEYGNEEMEYVPHLTLDRM